MGNSKGFANVYILKYHYTYQIKNNINDKTYIGRHSTNNLNDGYFGSGTILKRAIKKYGIENFSIVIMNYFDTYEDLIEEESFLVTKTYCESKENYNISVGGGAPLMYGEHNHMWKGGISASPFYRIKGPYDFNGKNNPMYGKKQSNKSKLKNLLSQSSRVKISVDGVVFESKRQCAAYFNISRDGVSYRLKSINFDNWVIL